MFLINTPRMFASVWSIVKRFMDEGLSPLRHDQALNRIYDYLQALRIKCKYAVQTSCQRCQNSLIP